MSNKDAEDLIGAIGGILAEDNEFPLDKTLLYAEVRPSMVSIAIFKDAGDYILYRLPDLDRLSDILLDLLYTEPEKTRWAEIEYFIRGDKFEIKFNYADEIKPESDPFARRNRIVKRYLGDKPIVYPPLIPEDDGVPTYDL